MFKSFHHKNVFNAKTTKKINYFIITTISYIKTPLTDYRFLTENILRLKCTLSCIY